MRCKDMPQNQLPRRTYQVILCCRCYNEGGTMVKNKEGHWEHPKCNRPVNVKNMQSAANIVGTPPPEANTPKE